MRRARRPEIQALTAAGRTCDARGSSSLAIVQRCFFLVCQCYFIHVMDLADVLAVAASEGLVLVRCAGCSTGFKGVLPFVSFLIIFDVLLICVFPGPGVGSDSFPIRFPVPPPTRNSSPLSFLAAGVSS